MCEIKEEIFLVYGGRDGAQNLFFGDAYLAHVTSAPPAGQRPCAECGDWCEAFDVSWEQMATAGCAPAPRAGHAAVVRAGVRVFVFSLSLSLSVCVCMVSLSLSVCMYVCVCVCVCRMSSFFDARCPPPSRQYSLPIVYSSPDDSVPISVIYIWFIGVHTLGHILLPA